MNEITKLIIIVLVASIIGGFVSGLVGNQSDPVGASSGFAHYQTESFLQGVSAGARDQFSVSNTGVLTTSGNITITTSNTATSSISVGCIESYATSTDTVMRLSATTTAPTTAVWVYGACSGL